jgi:hypothetical protein
MSRITRTAAALLSSALLFAGLAAPASAQPVVTGGLVNVTIVLDDVEIITLEDVNVAVALALAANVCDVNVNVLSQQFRNGQTTCENAFTGDQAIITAG